MEHVRLARDERLPLLLGEGESHLGLLAVEGEPDDASDAELHAIMHDRLVAARQPFRHAAHVVNADRHLFTIAPRIRSAPLHNSDPPRSRGVMGSG